MFHVNYFGYNDFAYIDSFVQNSDRYREELYQKLAFNDGDDEPLSLWDKKFEGIGSTWNMGRLP